MDGFTLHRLGGIHNAWITDIFSEVLCTFILSLFVYASGAQSLLTHGQASNPTSRALATGCGLLIALYVSQKATGASANPNSTIMFCLTGKIFWKQLPLYIIGELVGAFLGATVTYGVYKDMLTSFDGGNRSVYGDTASAQLFTSLPDGSAITKLTGFFDVVVGTSLLTGSVAAMNDPSNSNAHLGILPIANAFMLFGILMAMGVNTAAAFNSAIDFSGRLFASIIYGPEVFSHWNYWWWVPLVGGVAGSVIGPFVYQLLVGNHLHVKDQEYTGKDEHGDFQIVHRIDTT